ncbi:thermonuclease family protein [Metamycoplasma hyosynoviae]|uniref:thermonuclease family protein n=1 Tax=Metamycoplasma hyosynoviae TaxID=29559 RepID=UPI002366218D|nr:thermonuclease family protein [Metamycoplasma hyosynoviae]MDD7894732.1 thermonuclease family protein [Metamycoplasma hyosynoviae]
MIRQVRTKTSFKPLLIPISLVSIPLTVVVQSCWTTVKVKNLVLINSKADYDNLKVSDFRYDGIDLDKYWIGNFRVQKDTENSKIWISFAILVKGTYKIVTNNQTFSFNLPEPVLPEGNIYFKNNLANTIYDDIPYPINNSSDLKINEASKINVTNIRDGDTFEASNKEAYRFAGVDTPEKRKKIGSEWHPTEGIQYKYAMLATHYTEFYAYLSFQAKYQNYEDRATEIYVVPQKTKNGKHYKYSEMSDHYGRIVSIVFYKDIHNKFHCLNEKLVLEGKARKNYISLNSSSIYYTSNTSFHNQLEEASQKAQANKLGIYSDPKEFANIFP